MKKMLISFLALITASSHAAGETSSKELPARNWNIKYILWAENASLARTMHELSIKNSSKLDAKSDRKYSDIRAILKYEPVVTTRDGKKISLLLLRFDPAGEVISGLLYGKKLSGYWSTTQHLGILEPDSSPQKLYFLGFWRENSFGPEGEALLPAVCTASDMILYKMNIRSKNEYFGNIGCREWTAQLYDPQRPYIDITTYYPDGSGYVGSIMGWSRFSDPPKPVIGMSGKDWYCLHDCPSGQSPGLIANIKEWTREHGYPVPVPPSQQPTYPDSFFHSDYDDSDVSGELDSSSAEDTCCNSCHSSRDESSGCLVDTDQGRKTKAKPGPVRNPVMLVFRAHASPIAMMNGKKFAHLDFQVTGNETNIRQADKLFIYKNGRFMGESEVMDTLSREQEAEESGCFLEDRVRVEIPSALYATGTIATRKALGRQTARATDKPNAGQRAAARKLLAAILAKEAVPSNLRERILDSARVHVLTQGKRQTFIIDANYQGDDLQVMPFVIADFDKNGSLRPAFVQVHKGEPHADTREERYYLDQLDLDGDGIAEIIANYTRYESGGFSVFKRAGHKWVEIHVQENSGC